MSHPVDTPPSPLDERTRQAYCMELLQFAAKVGAATVPLELSDVELLQEVSRIRAIEA